MVDLTKITQSINNGLANPQRDLRGFTYKVNAFANQVNNLTGLVNSFTNPSVNNPPGKVGGVGGLSRLEAIAARGDPILGVDWMGFIYDSASGSGSEVINWAYLDSIQTSGISLSPVSVFRGGTMKHYAGPISIESLNITLYSDSTGRALKLASSWLSSVYDNRNGNYRLPKDYKKTIHVYLLDSARKTVCLFKFSGCFPVSWNSYSLDGSSGTTTLPTSMTLSVDSVSIEGDADTVSSTLEKATAAMNPNFPIIGKIPNLPSLPNIPGLPQLPSWPFS